MWWPALTQVNIPTPVPMVVNFLPSWWHQNYGIVFGERWVLDADYRVSTLTEMVRLLHARFDDIGMGQADPQPQLALFDLQNATIPAIFGCDVVFPEDNYAWSRHLPPERLPSLALPADWTDRFPVGELVAQAGYLTKRYGRPVSPSWNTQGVQNVAVLVAGTDFLAAYYEKPDQANHLLHVAAGAIEASIDFMARSGSLKDPFVHANCTAMMVSPALFSGWLLPFDLSLAARVAGHGSRYGIHHCGRADGYLSVYATVPDLVWLEVGMGSDVTLAQRTLPHSHVQLIVDTVFMARATPAEVRRHIGQLLAGVPDLNRFSLAIPDLEYGTPDANVRAAVEAVRTLASTYKEVTM